MPRHCAECGYNLQGAAETGTCPECGQDYIPSTILRRDPLTRREVAWRFGWPLAIYSIAAFLLASDFASRFSDALGMIALTSFLAAYVNIIVQTWLLRRAGMRRRSTERMLNRNLVIWMALATVLAPLAAGAGLLIRSMR